MKKKVPPATTLVTEDEKCQIIDNIRWLTEEKSSYRLIGFVKWAEETEWSVGKGKTYYGCKISFVRMKCKCMTMVFAH